MTNPPGPDVVCVGETMAMLSPSDFRPLAVQSVLNLTVGGAESNVACALTALGHRAAWMGRVGADPFGERILADLAARGVDVAAVEYDPVHRTGVYFKDTGPGPQHTEVHYYRHDSAASHMGPELARHPLLARARLLHLSGITAALSDNCAELVEELVTRRAVTGPVVSFDVNHRAALWPGGRDHAARTLLRLARAADVVFVGRDEAEALWGTRKPEEVRDLLAPTPLVVVKDAGHGATSYDRQGSDVAEVFVPAPRSRVVERVGAGDAFAAGYLAALLEGRDAAGRLRLGHLVAAATLATRADIPTVPSRPELDRLLALDDAAWPEPHRPTSPRSTMSTPKTEVRTDGAPAPAWVFSQGVRKGPVLQVSGQGPQDPASGEYLHAGDVKAQTRRTLENVRAVLEAGGASVSDVLMFRVYLTKREDFAAMNEVYGEFIEEHVKDGVKPCRTTVFVELPHEVMLVEIDAQAVVG